MLPLVLEDHELRLVMNSPFTEHGRVLFKIIEHEIKVLRESLRDNPRMTEEVKLDLRYILGGQHSLEWLRDAPKRAEEELKHREKGGIR